MSIALPAEAQLIARTPRLTLRTWTAADVEPIAEVWSDPDVMRFAGAVPRDRIARALAAGLAAQERHGVCLWAVESAEMGLIGDCGFHHHPRGLELGYHLARRAWGRGYATEAARAAIAYAIEHVIAMPSGDAIDESAPSILAWVHPGNRPSSAVLERLGFTCEGPDPDEEHELRFRLAATRPTPAPPR